MRKGRMRRRRRIRKKRRERTKKSGKMRRKRKKRRRKKRRRGEQGRLGRQSGTSWASEVFFLSEVRMERRQRLRFPLPHSAERGGMCRGRRCTWRLSWLSWRVITFSCSAHHVLCPQSLWGESGLWLRGLCLSVCLRLLLSSKICCFLQYCCCFLKENRNQVSWGSNCEFPNICLKKLQPGSFSDDQIMTGPIR